MGSILEDTKKQLGLDPDADGFDPELIIHINSVLSDLTQLGVGPDAGYAITDDTKTWAQFMGTDARLNSAQAYMFLCVKMLFDPPQTGYLLTSYEKLKEEAAWRLTVKTSNPASTLTGGKTSLTGSRGDEHTMRLTDPVGGETLIEAGGTYVAEFISKPVGYGRTGSSRSVPLDLSEVADGVLILPIVIEDGTYVVRRVSPRRTLLTIEVTAE